jgi:asparagine synthase (glutamine-hydrolysing)
MCGIAGIYRSKPEADDRSVVQAMLDQLRSRGPDGEGILSEGLLCLGHRRLAVLDLSDAARQPMVSASGRYLISFNGEIYNYRDLIDRLDIAPGSLRTRGDTEILLRAWERWGSDCLNHLAGQWAFALYDRLEERLWLVRDRFGEKPLYYHEQDGVLTFSSTIMGLLRAPWISREIQPEALVECLTLRYVVSPRTIVQGISKIPPGHLLTAVRSRREIHSWWSPRFRSDATPTGPRRKEETAEEFGGLLGQACRRCLVSDRPVALLLSNGIDSAALASVLCENQPSFRAFTYEVGHSWDAPGFTVGELGVGVAFRHETIRVTYDEVARCLVPALAGLNEQVGDGSALAFWLLIRKARPQATVFLCGQGGDEVLAGYRLSQDRFRLAALRKLCRLPLPFLDRAVPHFVNGEEPPSVRRRVLARCPAHLAPAAARFLIHHPLPAWALESLMGTASVPGAYLSTIDRLYKECSPRDSDLDRIQEVMLGTFLAENLLSVGDSVAMASSAELRMPYLDRDLVEFVFGLPREMRAGLWPGRTNTKLVLRWWGRKRLSRQVLRHPKRGFRYGSIRALLQSPASDLRSLILDSGSLRRHVGGLSAWMEEPPGLPRGTWGATTWTLASLAAWCQAAGVS